MKDANQFEGEAGPVDENPAVEDTESAAGMQTWRLTLAYDGTDYCGWQVQPGERTIQGELQAALRRVTGEAPLPQGSGRTDAGVHALGQVTSFTLAARIPAENLERALNRTLPEAIRVLEARVAAENFHARHSAVAKTYEYRVFRGAVCPPFMARYVYACRWPYDLNALQAAAQEFLGEHDFLSFAATDPELRQREVDASLPRRAHPPAGPSVRRIFLSQWEERETAEGALLVYRVRGNGFLHHMVRNLVGTMLDVGRGQRRVEELAAMLAARRREAAGPTAPAQGLFLHSVEYGDDAHASQSA
ncbi:MAG TPA: tRNA pseudouridine(38-40) synthase TruA [Terracidiphilus sp.]|nr:tRNA pseudouridine(38-40) synthase TruA [Terracidiphilus sp.]